MPEIRYTMEVAGDTFSERDYFPFTENAFEFIAIEVIGPLQEKREKLGEPKILLKRVEVLNPFVHKHTWKRTHLNRSSLRGIYYCMRCQITGWRPYSVFDGDRGPINRDEQYKNERLHGLCHDPLKQMPKKLF